MHFLRLKLTYFQYRWYLTTVALDQSSFVHSKMLFYDKIIKNRSKSIPRDEFIRGSTLLKDFSVLPSTGLTHLNTNVDTTLPHKHPQAVTSPHLLTDALFFLRWALLSADYSSSLDTCLGKYSFRS